MNFLRVKKLRDGSINLQFLSEQEYKALSSGGFLKDETVYQTELSIDELASNSLIHAADTAVFNERLSFHRDRFKKISGEGTILEDQAGL